MENDKPCCHRCKKTIKPFTKTEDWKGRKYHKKCIREENKYYIMEQNLGYKIT